MEQDSYIDRLRERLAQRPDSVLLISLAEEYRKKGRIQEALSLLKEGVAKKPDAFISRLILGEWYVQLNMLEEAKEELSQVIRMAPQNVHGHRLLAETYKKLGYRENASDEYRAVLRIAPDDRDALSFLESEGYRERDLAKSVSDLPASQKDPIPLSVAPMTSQDTEQTYAKQIEEAEKHAAHRRYKEALALYDAVLASHQDILKIIKRTEKLKSLREDAEKKKRETIVRLRRFSEAITTHFTHTASV